MPEKRGKKRTIRVQRLIDGELLELIQQGISIPQIAREKHVDPTTIYGLLDLVAKENGYASREELLMFPHKPRSDVMSRTEVEREYVNVKEMSKLYKEADTLMEAIISEMQSNVEEEYTR